LYTQNGQKTATVYLKKLPILIPRFVEIKIKKKFFLDFTFEDFYLPIQLVFKFFNLIANNRGGIVQTSSYLGEIVFSIVLQL
jgi:hypothetical protein